MGKLPNNWKMLAPQFSVRPRPGGEGDATPTKRNWDTRKICLTSFFFFDRNFSFFIGQ